MITRAELREYAKLSALNLGQAEKDFFQSIILFILYQEYGKSMVFKGGTALKKCHGLDRFSEDLDFTCVDKVDVKKLENGLKRFNLESEMEMKGYKGGLKVILRIKGPLYIGVRPSLCKFIIDFSFRENVILKPEIRTIGRFLKEIPMFDVFVMQESEILAEKIRAIMTRIKARDIYDLWFLLEKGVKFDEKLARKKLNYYRQEWNHKDFVKKLNMKTEIWETELRPLIKNMPDFKKVRRFILQNLSTRKHK